MYRSILSESSHHYLLLHLRAAAQDLRSKWVAEASAGEGGGGRHDAAASELIFDREGRDAMEKAE
jgi:hypothetical protein